MVLEIFIMWGCVDLKDCFSAGDLSNIASTYIGIIIGALIGAFISWLIYNRQEKTAVIQKEIQGHILNLEEKHEISLEKHENILEKIQIVEQNHDEMLNKILTLDKKINNNNFEENYFLTNHHSKITLRTIENYLLNIHKYVRRKSSCN